MNKETILEVYSYFSELLEFNQNSASLRHQTKLSKVNFSEVCYAAKAIYSEISETQSV